MNVRRFTSNKTFTCNLFVCQSEKGNFIVDPGYFDNSIKEYIDSIGGIDFVLITHGHMDHIGGMDELKKYYPNITFYAYFEEQDVIYSSKYNCSKAFGKAYEPSVKCELLGEGKNKINDIEFEVVHTPGHTKGGVIYIFNKDKVVFTGDTIIASSIGRTDLPTGRDSELMNSIQKIKELGLKDDFMMHFGHEKSFSYAQLQRINPYFR